MNGELKISWSGCKDSQTSADATEAGKATGAMSYAFIHALSKYPSHIKFDSISYDYHRNRSKPPTELHPAAKLYSVGYFYDLVIGVTHTCSCQ